MDNDSSPTSREIKLWSWDDERLFFEGDYVAVLESVDEDAPQPDTIVRLLNERQVSVDEVAALRNDIEWRDREIELRGDEVADLRAALQGLYDFLPRYSCKSDRPDGCPVCVARTALKGEPRVG